MVGHRWRVVDEYKRVDWTRSADIDKENKIKREICRGYLQSSLEEDSPGWRSRWICQFENKNHLRQVLPDTKTKKSRSFTILEKDFQSILLILVKNKNQRPKNTSSSCFLFSTKLGEVPVGANK